MITFLENLHLDMTIVSIVGFVYILAFVAIYQMRNIKEGLLFLLYITGSALLIFLFMRYSFISAILVLIYIGHLVYNNVGNNQHQNN